jgi:hypothetical protein
MLVYIENFAKTTRIKILNNAIRGAQDAGRTTRAAGSLRLSLR